jgi:hypothetical protein
MHRQVIEQAIAQLRGAGEAVSARRIRRLIVEQHGQGPSYRDIYQHLRDTGALVVGEVSAALEEADDEDLPAAPAPAEGDADDGVDLAEAAVAEARRRLESLHEARPVAQTQLAEARTVLLNAAGRQLTVQHANRRDWLPDDDPSVAQAEAAMTQAGRRFRAAKARLDALPQQIEAAQAAVRVAEQEVYLAREHPDLVAARAAVQAEEPTDTDEAGESYRRRSIWRQQVASARAACDAAVQAAGLRSGGRAMTSFEQTLHQRVSELRKRDPRLDDHKATARVLNGDRALYAAYRQVQWPLPAAEPETRLMPASSPAAAEARRRAEGLVSKSAGGLGMRDALSRVFREDPTLYQRYVAEQADEAAPDEPPAAGSPRAEMTREVMALARTFAPTDPEGLGLLKARVAIGELHKTVRRKQGTAV